VDKSERATPAAAGRDPRIDQLGGSIGPQDSPRPARAQASARRPLANVEYVLAEIRLARAHASLQLNLLDTIGTALKAGLITPEMAVSELRACQFFEPLVDRPVICEVGQ
jgi:hypothetical protein